MRQIALAFESYPDLRCEQFAPADRCQAGAKSAVATAAAAVKPPAVLTWTTSTLVNYPLSRPRASHAPHNP